MLTAKTFCNSIITPEYVESGNQILHKLSTMVIISREREYIGQKLRNLSTMDARFWMKLFFETFEKLKCIFMDSFQEKNSKIR